MGLISVFGIGILIIIMILIKKQSLIEIVGNHLIVKKLSEKQWFHHKWKSGLFLFVLNAVLFLLAVGLIFLSGLFMIPYLHILIILAATLTSIYLWIAMRVSVQRPKKDQLVMGLVGSSFYVILFLIFLYLFMILEPATPEHDTFMAAIGLMLGMVVSFVAWMTCFFITAFQKK
ncbi:hypothetical protein [Siminovitchia terrae]|uniref:Uncharacterized protein n=1 Tax=Siminovitchia terrae TaxID=1914933 RepID=A0A429X5H7_SIMTE|nr:hypothetical protein [Siminovitchia terrae]RST58550.1 hypothetical protein D5F11_017155 [Siminovitchia terrae]